MGSGKFYQFLRPECSPLVHSHIMYSTHSFDAMLMEQKPCSKTQNPEIRLMMYKTSKPPSGAIFFLT